ncbi:MAG: hypothetical protein FJ220_01225 [Kiritimatiellaceae bacterium]|nr:hypothetical protein [Kiritimatiellaceae bacterium]
METNQLLESFAFRFSAAGIREPERTAEELLAHVLHCRSCVHHHRAIPEPKSSGQTMAIIRRLEELSVRIENGESPQEVLGCVDF